MVIDMKVPTDEREKGGGKTIRPPKRSGTIVGPFKKGPNGPSLGV